MKRVRWSDSAVRDVELIRDRLSADRPDQVQPTIDRIVLSTDLILRHPGLGASIGYRRWRKWRAEHTPYLIFYQPDRDALTIVRVLHERSDWWSLAQ